MRTLGLLLVILAGILIAAGIPETPQKASPLELRGVWILHEGDAINACAVDAVTVSGSGKVRVLVDGRALRAKRVDPEELIALLGEAQPLCRARGRWTPPERSP